MINDQDIAPKNSSLGERIYISAEALKENISSPFLVEENNSAIPKREPITDLGLSAEMRELLAKYSGGQMPQSLFHLIVRTVMDTGRSKLGRVPNRFERHDIEIGILLAFPQMAHCRTRKNKGSPFQTGNATEQRLHEALRRYASNYQTNTARKLKRCAPPIKKISIQPAGLLPVTDIASSNETSNTAPLASESVTAQHSAALISIETIPDEQAVHVPSSNAQNLTCSGTVSVCSNMEKPTNADVADLSRGSSDKECTVHSNSELETLLSVVLQSFE